VSVNFLLSARDIGAAGHVLALAKGLVAAGYNIQLVLQGPALKLAARLGVACEDAGRWLDIRHPLSSREGLAHRVDAIAPCAVICGLSSFHTNGIDEALMLAARDQGVRCFALQDFWGDVKRVDGRGADDYFVLDETAAEITRAATNANCHVIGSLKHARFLDIDYENERNSFRQSLMLAEHEKVVCLFGQALQSLPGHRVMLNNLVDAILKSNGVRLIYKPHPLEDEAAIVATTNLIAERTHAPIPVVAGPIDPVLAGADIALSCFSTIGIDAAYLARAQGKGPVVVYADYPADITAYWQNESGLKILPPVHDGYALEAKDSGSLAKCLNDSFKPEVRTRLIDRIKEVLPDPKTAIGRAVACLEHNLGLKKI
jgi:hypothetical protein